MIKLALIPLLFGLHVAHARPQAAGTGQICSGSLQWLNGGELSDVAKGTHCVMVDGKATFPSIVGPATPGQGLVAVESPAVAPAASSGVTVPPPGGGGQAVLKPLVSKLKFTNLGPGVALTCATAAATVTASVPKPKTSSKNKDGNRYIAYWSAYHGTGKDKLPSSKQFEGVTHLILAFWDPKNPLLNAFISSSNTEWGLDIAGKLRKAAGNPDLKVMAAFGGWDLDEFFRPNAIDGNRDELAQLFADFVAMYQLDGVDVDWEYPVTNGGSYKTTRLPEPCDKNNNVLLMQSIRNKLEGLKSTTNPITEYVLSIAVPAGALDGDMSAYDKGSAKEIDKVVDFWNVMSYDATNRRSTKANHHGGGKVIKESLAKYTGSTGLDLPPKKLNIGFPMYARVFSMAAATDSDCPMKKAIGCHMGNNTFENPADGKDLGKAGAILFRDDLNTLLTLGSKDFNTMEAIQAYAGWGRVNTTGTRDDDALATYAFDDTSKNFYTWLTGKDMYDSCKQQLPNAGGIMVWSLDQDYAGAEGGEHFAGLQKCIKGE